VASVRLLLFERDVAVRQASAWRTAGGLNFNIASPAEFEKPFKLVLLPY